MVEPSTRFQALPRGYMTRSTDMVSKHSVWQSLPTCLHLKEAASCGKGMGFQFALPGADPLSVSHCVL